MCVRVFKIEADKELELLREYVNSDAFLGACLTLKHDCYFRDTLVYPRNTVYNAFDSTDTIKEGSVTAANINHGWSKINKAKGEKEIHNLQIRYLGRNQMPNYYMSFGFWKKQNNK